MGFLKGKEKLVGAVVGAILMAALGLLGLQSSEFKAGLCGESAPAAAVK